MKRLFVGLILSSFFLFSCSRSLNSPVTGNDPGSAIVTVKIGSVGALAKRLDISFSKLIISLSAPKVPTITDTFTISGNTQTTISKTYNGLASLITWTLTATSFDTKDSIIHNGSDTFMVLPHQTVNVPPLVLDSRFSMLKANFFPIRDSVTRCELLVDGITVDDSSFAKQSLPDATVKLAYDYLKTNVLQRVSLNVYGNMWGFDTLLYTGDTAITPLPGKDSSYAITLQWVGPGQPPAGEASMMVSLGAVGTIGINGELGAKDTVDLTKGLAAYYPFNGNANDESGNANNGMIGGSITTITTDRFLNPNSAYLFQYGYIIVNHSTTIDVGSGDFTLSAWIKPNGIQGNGDGYCDILSKRDRITTQGWVFQMSYGNGINPLPHLKLWTSHNGAALVNYNFNVGEWYHVLVIRDKTNSQAIYYINGQLIGSVALLNSDESNSGNLVIGALGDGPGTQWFGGCIDDIRIYNRAITDKEVGQLYHEGGY